MTVTFKFSASDVAPGAPFYTTGALTFDVTGQVAAGDNIVVVVGIPSFGDESGDWTAPAGFALDDDALADDDGLSATLSATVWAFHKVADGSETTLTFVPPHDDVWFGFCGVYSSDADVAHAAGDFVADENGFGTDGDTLVTAAGSGGDRLIIYVGTAEDSNDFGGGDESPPQFSYPGSTNLRESVTWYDDSGTYGLVNYRATFWDEEASGQPSRTFTLHYQDGFGTGGDAFRLFPPLTAAPVDTPTLERWTVTSCDFDEDFPNPGSIAVLEDGSVVVSAGTSLDLRTGLDAIDAGGGTVRISVDETELASSGPGANVAIDVPGAAGSSGTFATSGHGHELVTYSSAAAAIGIDSGASAGSSGTAPARGDHVHQVTTTDAPSGADVSVGSAPSPAAAGAIARAAHGHRVDPDAGGGADDSIDAAGTTGSATGLARSGHGHKLVTYSSTPASPTSTSGAAGTSGTAPSRGDHRHPALPYTVDQYGADPTGATDSSSAVQAMHDALGYVQLGNGTYLVSSDVTFSANGFMLAGQGRTNTLLKLAGGTIKLGAGLQNSCFRDLKIQATAAGNTDIFTPLGNFSAALFMNLFVSQLATGKRIWNGGDYNYIDNMWLECVLSEPSNGTVNAFYMVTSASKVNSNTWMRCQVNGSTGASSLPFFYIECTSASDYNYNNNFRDVAVETCDGGFAKLLTANGCLFEQVNFYDLTTTINDLIYLGAGSGGLASRRNDFTDCHRMGGTLGAGLNDIKLESAKATHTTLFRCDTASGSGYTVDMGTNGACRVIGMSTATISNISNLGDWSRGDITDTSTGTQNAYTPTGLAAAVRIRWNGASALTINGLTGGTDGRALIIENVTTAQVITITHNSGSAASTDVIRCANALNCVLRGQTSVLLVYDATSTCWRAYNTPINTTAQADDTIDAAGATGSTGVAAASGHGHKLSTYSSSPAQLGTATSSVDGSSAGTSGTAPARGDHVHGAGGSPDIQVFASSSTGNASQTTGTWNKPVGKFASVRVILIGGGGGGGGGGSVAAATACTGGAGGGGGAFQIFDAPYSAFNSTETIKTGDGGTGGNGVTNSDGNPGQAGGNSSMTMAGTVFATCNGGGGGGAGHNSTTASTAGTGGTVHGGGASSGGTGGIGQAAGAGGTNGSNNRGESGASGAGGGGVTAATPGATSAGGAGGAGAAAGAGGTLGAAGTGTGGSGGGHPTDRTTNQWVKGGGGGGGGSESAASQNGGSGGAGAKWGGGGGGGGACRELGTSGAGGNGGPGLVVVITT